MKRYWLAIAIVLFAQLAFAQVEIGVNFGAPAFFNAALGYWNGPYIWIYVEDLILQGKDGHGS